MALVVFGELNGFASYEKHNCPFAPTRQCTWFWLESGLPWFRCYSASRTDRRSRSIADRRHGKMDRWDVWQERTKHAHRDARMLRIDKSEVDTSGSTQRNVRKISSLALFPLDINLVPRTHNFTFSHFNGLLLHNMQMVMNNVFAFIWNEVLVFCVPQNFPEGTMGRHIQCWIFPEDNRPKGLVNRMQMCLPTCVYDMRDAVILLGSRVQKSLFSDFDTCPLCDSWDYLGRRKNIVRCVATNKATWLL